LKLAYMKDEPHMEERAFGLPKLDSDEVDDEGSILLSSAAY